MTLLPHQIETVQKARPILLEKGNVYIFGPPRIGKSLIALGLYQITKEFLKGTKRCLVLTKKNAIEGWQKWGKENLEGVEIRNYEALPKLKSEDFSMVIIDEAHNFGAFPRFSQRIKNTRAFCTSKPIIFLSGTPVVEGMYKLYSQFWISSYSPFYKYSNPYAFFREFGISNRMWMNGQYIEKYDTFEDERIWELVKDRVVTIDYKDAGFKYDNEDLVYEIDDGNLGDYYKGISKSRFISDSFDVTEYPSGKYWAEPNGLISYPLENISAVNQALHRLCGGFYKDLILPRPKYDWLMKYIDTLPDYTKVAVMAYFVEEQIALNTVFSAYPQIDLFSSTKYCEGVDLSGYDVFILYSFGYSGVKFVQLRDRIVNITKNKKTRVIIPLLRNGLDREIYNIVSKKKNFNTQVLTKSQW